MVTVTASHVVKPAERTPETVMYLPDCDQLRPLTYAPTIYFYKPKQTDQEFPRDAIQNLKDSLRIALVKFYPLAGRLHWTNGGRVELHCNSMGALILEAESQLKIDDFGDFTPDHRIRSLIPSPDDTATPIHEVPLLLVQLTRLSCGGISFGSAISLAVVDGQSALQFTLEWARIARGENSNHDLVPFFDRTILLLSDEYMPQAFQTLEPSDYFTPLPGLASQPDNSEERKKATTSITLRLSREQIEKLKNKANQDHLGLAMTTRFEAVSAHIWKCVSKARMLKPEQETVLYLSVDYRSRINPPLPPTYFGNAVIPVPIRATAGELLSKPLSYASNKIKEAIANVKDEYVRGYLAWARNIPDVSSHRHYRATGGGGQGPFFGNPNLWISSWAGLPFYGANYGWGEEVYKGPGSLPHDGKFFILVNRNGNGSRDGDGSFVIPLRLQMVHIGAFHKCFYQDILEMPVFYSQL